MHNERCTSGSEGGHLETDGGNAPRRRCPTQLSDKLADGRTFRILTVVDQFTRECVCLEADRAMTGMQVAQALERTKVERGKLPASSLWATEPSFAVEPWKPG